MDFLQEISLELNSNTAYTSVGAKQGDSASRSIKVHITENGEDWTIPSGVTASYRVRKPDGYAIWNDATIDYEENAVYITLTEQTLAAAGRAYADILFTSGSEGNQQILSTVSFIIIIMASPDIVGNIASTNEFSEILDLVENAQAVINESEAWAVGTRNGTPVTDDDPQYDNYAKYYAEQAEDSRQAIEDLTVTAEAIDPVTSGTSISVEKTVNPSTGIVNLHFNIPRGNTGEVNFVTFDIDPTTGELLMNKPDDLSPQVSFSLNNTNGNLYVEIVN